MNAAAFELTQDWVCEVLSPGTGATDRADKVPLYAAEGVGHVWLVDPLLRLVLDAGELKWRFGHRADSPIHGPPGERRVILPIVVLLAQGSEARHPWSIFPLTSTRNPTPTSTR
jgi:hypothetical protein